MAHWYYKGRTTAAINHPTQGPIVLTPRMKFEASVASVQHLLNADLVKRLPDPPVQTSAPVPASAPPPKEVSVVEVPKSVPEVEEAPEVEEPGSSASGPDDVVASPATEAEVDSAPVDAETESSKKPEEESPTPKKRRGRRRSS